MKAVRAQLYMWTRTALGAFATAPELSPPRLELS